MKKWIVILFLLTILTLAFLAVVIFMKYPIVSGDYSSVIIYKKNDYESRTEITNKDEIEQIKDLINVSPRRFRGWIPQLDYDHGERGYIVFTDKNSNKDKKLSIFVWNGNIITRYWDVDTDFFQ